MRPFPGRGISKEQQIFNYRLSRARRIVENAFGILAARWRVYHSKIAILPERVNSIVKATCALHNFLQTQTTPAQVNSLIREIGEDNNAVLQNVPGMGNRAGVDAMDIRNAFMNYFVNISQVEWQAEHVNRGTITH